MSQSNVTDDLVQAYRQARQRKVDAEVDMQTIRSKIAAQTEFADITHDLVDGQGEVLGTWNEVESNRFDSKRFKEDYPDIYHAYTKSSTARRLEF